MCTTNLWAYTEQWEQVQEKSTLMIFVVLEHRMGGLLVRYIGCQATVYRLWSFGAPCKCCKVYSMCICLKNLSQPQEHYVCYIKKRKNKKEKQVVTFLQHQPCFINKSYPFIIYICKCFTRNGWVQLPMHQLHLGNKKIYIFVPQPMNQIESLEVLWLQAHAHVVILAPTFYVHLWALVQVKKKKSFFSA